MSLQNKKQFCKTVFRKHEERKMIIDKPAYLRHLHCDFPKDIRNVEWCLQSWQLILLKIILICKIIFSEQSVAKQYLKAEKKRKKSTSSRSYGGSIS